MGGYGRPIVDKRTRVSEEHLFLLAYCAKKANFVIKLMTGSTVDPAELVNEGWWHCARRVEKADLNRITANVINSMIAYGTHQRQRPIERVTDAREQLNATQRTDCRDAVELLRERMDPDLFEVGWASYAMDLDAAETSFHCKLRGRQVQYLRKKFLEQAAAILESSEIAAYLNGFK